jgi:hypothetical protein
VNREPEESDLLLPFEISSITGDYRKYYTIKRNNFFASIQNLPDLWDFFCKIDEVLRREVEDLEVMGDTSRTLPVALYINAHAKMRVSIELAFSQCIQEARSVLRDAVECVAHAHHMLRSPANLNAWLERDKPGGLKVFKETFEKNKKKVLFQGLEDLYEKYGQLSEAGSHPTWRSFGNRMSFRSEEDSRWMVLHYTGTPDQAFFAKEMFSRLLTCLVMEHTFYQDFGPRLQLDGRLMRMRQDLEVFKEELRSKIIARYQIKPPAQNP